MFIFSFQNDDQDQEIIEKIRRKKCIDRTDWKEWTHPFSLTARLKMALASPGFPSFFFSISRT